MIDSNAVPSNVESLHGDFHDVNRDGGCHDGKGSYARDLSYIHDELVDLRGAMVGELHDDSHLLPIPGPMKS